MGTIYYLKGKTLQKARFSRKKIKDCLKKKIPFWVDATYADKKALELMGKTLDLHPLTIDDIYRKQTRVKIEDFDKYIFIVLYGIDNELKNYEIDFILGKGFVFSVHRKEDCVSEKITKTPDKVSYLLKKGPEFLLHELMQSELENYFPVLEDLDKKREIYEKSILKNPSNKKIAEIMRIKEKLNKAKRNSSALREKILLLTRLNNKLIKKQAIPFYRDLYDTSIRITDELDNDRESLSSIIDLHMSVLSNKMNEVMKVLAVISTIMLPLSVITGIYGMNFFYLPLSKWVNGFWIIIGIMLLVMLSMMFFFKKRNWF